MDVMDAVVAMYRINEWTCLLGEGQDLVSNLYLTPNILMNMFNMGAMDAMNAIDAVVTKDAIETINEMNGWTDSW